MYIYFFFSKRKTKKSNLMCWKKTNIRSNIDQAKYRKQIGTCITSFTCSNIDQRQCIEVTACFSSIHEQSLPHRADPGWAWTSRAKTRYHRGWTSQEEGLPEKTQETENDDEGLNKLLLTGRLCSLFFRRKYEGILLNCGAMSIHLQKKEIALLY